MCKGFIAMSRERKKAVKLLKGKKSRIRTNNSSYNFWIGIGSLLGVVNPVIHESINSTIYYDDKEAIKSDWNNVGKDMKRSIEKLTEEEECV